MENTKQDKLLSISKASLYAGCHANTLRNWEKQGLILPRRLGSGKQRRYSIEEIDALLASFNSTNDPRFPTKK